jgi:hypothetical protein
VKASRVIGSAVVPPSTDATNGEYREARENDTRRRVRDSRLPGHGAGPSSPQVLVQAPKANRRDGRTREGNEFPALGGAFDRDSPQGPAASRTRLRSVGNGFATVRTLQEWHSSRNKILKSRLLGFGCRRRESLVRLAPRSAGGLDARHNAPNQEDASGQGYARADGPLAEDWTEGEFNDVANNRSQKKGARTNGIGVLGGVWLVHVW